jgi:hypothetical protein
LRSSASQTELSGTTLVLPFGNDTAGTVSRCSSMSTTPPPRFPTADADMGVSFEVCADPRLVPALTALGYDRQSGNRFIRTQGTRALVIDVLAPSYLGRLMSNRPHGDLVVDEISGLLDALRLPPILVAARAILTDASQVDVRVPLPDVRAALVMKAHAYAGRLGDNDALDIWRLLQSADNAGHARTTGLLGAPRATPQYFCTDTPAHQAADLVGQPQAAPTRRGSAHWSPTSSRTPPAPEAERPVLRREPVARV